VAEEKPKVRGLFIGHAKNAGVAIGAKAPIQKIPVKTKNVRKPINGKTVAMVIVVIFLLVVFGSYVFGIFYSVRHASLSKASKAKEVPVRIDSVAVKQDKVDPIPSKQPLDEFNLFGPETAVLYDRGGISKFRIIPCEFLYNQTRPISGVYQPLGFTAASKDVGEKYGFRPASIDEILSMTANFHIGFGWEDVLWSSLPVSGYYSFVNAGEVSKGHEASGSISDLDVPDGKVVFVRK